MNLYCPHITFAERKQIQGLVFVVCEMLAIILGVNAVSVPLQRDAPLLHPRAYDPIPIRDTAASGWLLEVLRTKQTVGSFLSFLSFFVPHVHILTFIAALTYPRA